MVNSASCWTGGPVATGQCSFCLKRKKTEQSLRKCKQWRWPWTTTEEEGWMGYYSNKQNKFSTKQNKLRNNCQITHSNSDFSRMFNSKYIEVKFKYSNNIEPNITLCRKTGWGTTKLTILTWCWGQELWVWITCSKAYHSESVQEHWVLWVSHKQQKHTILNQCNTTGCSGSVINSKSIPFWTDAEIGCSESGPQRAAGWR